MEGSWTVLDSSDPLLSVTVGGDLEPLSSSSCVDTLTAFWLLFFNVVIFLLCVQFV